MSLLLRAYSNCPFTVKLHVAARYILCPFASFLRFFPKKGETLDVGCGHGLLLFLLSLRPNSNQCTYVGIDHAEAKIAVAQNLCLKNATFVVQAPEEVSSKRFDCVAIVDVLYCVPLEEWSTVLRHCHRALKEGGRLILVGTVDKPRWKCYLAHLQEIVAIRLLKITKGDIPHLEAVKTYVSYMETVGFRVTHIEPLDAGRPYPHCLLVGQKEG